VKDQGTVIKSRALSILRDIAITTIGILIALAANSWWQGRQDRRLEAELLREIRSELVADSIDLHGDRAAYAMMRDAIETLRNRFAANRPYTPDVDTLAGVQVFTRIHVSSSAAWQTLKTRGVGLIEDDSLRIGLTVFYETTNALLEIWNDRDGDLVDSSLRPYYRTHFSFIGKRGDEGVMRPLNYAALARDPVYHHMLAERSDVLARTLGVYEASMVEAARLMKRIDARLGRHS
jgi:hypothetical protein